MTMLAPYSWLRKISPELKQLDEPSPFGYAPHFNLVNFEAVLSETLKLEDLKVDIQPFNLCEKDQLIQGFENSDPYFFRIAPFRREAALLIHKEDFERLLTHFADKDLHRHILDEEFKRAFSHFVLLEALFAFQSAFTDRSINPQLLTEGELPNEGAWVKECTLTWKNSSLHARLIVPNALRQEWKNQYKDKSQRESSLLNDIFLDVHMEAGRVSLPRQEWGKIEKGDFLVLDSCHLEPGKDKGRVLLTINQTPVFRARIKDGTVKILEHPFFYEVGNLMSTPPKNEEHHDEELDEGLYDGFEEEGGESEEYTDENEEDESSLQSEEDVSETTIKKSPEPQIFKPEEIPLDVIIEAGRFQMTVSKLKELQPGSLVDLDIHPDQGVDLVINGVCIAKGELLKVGDTLGVRILDIAK